ncbi:NAD(P)(+) transhydrogenase (Re/Si-specific) subunit beta [Pantoea ananatis]|uniref:NAD(P)(+) transhydrogenase (Re/Si-specific) subunit beta n=1 Tax=Pantoea ananas TaxID=553 RepID=UPI00221EBF05|nr:NAD(P)(+) transhydrogenase (Re/Si-specific) subunit beta [Pantoea ananatis]
MVTDRMLMPQMVALYNGMGGGSLSGSVIAWAKLDINTAWRFKGQSAFNAAVFLAALVLGTLVVTGTGGAWAAGVLMTLPIGGADMPVVISLYNAFTGLAVGR